MHFPAPWTKSFLLPLADVGFSSASGPGFKTGCTRLPDVAVSSIAWGRVPGRGCPAEPLGEPTKAAGEREGDRFGLLQMRHRAAGQPRQPKKLSSRPHGLVLRAEPELWVIPALSGFPGRNTPLFHPFDCPSLLGDTFSGWHQKCVQKKLFCVDVWLLHFCCPV